MLKRAIYLILILLATNQSYSQSWSRYKYEGFFGIGATNFMGDIPAPTPVHPTADYVWVNFFNSIGYTANVGLRYNFEERQYFTATLFIGQLFGKDPSEDPKYWDRGYEFRSLFTEFSARYEYQIINERRKTTVYRKLGESGIKNFSLPTYLFVGLGGTASIGKSKAIINEGKNVVTDNYFNLAPVIPFGVGFKYKINRLTYLNLETSMRLALGDKIDGASGSENHGFGIFLDQYQSITFNLVHKLRQNPNGSPKLKRK